MLTQRSRILLLSLTILSGATAESKPYYFSFGGGYGPEGSQVVLEKNMEIFSEQSRASSGDNLKSYRFFGGGCSPEILDVFETVPLSIEDRMFATFFEASEHRDCTWRHNRLADLSGKATASNISAFLSKMAAELSPQDSARIYYTSHGTGDASDDYESN